MNGILAFAGTGISFLSLEYLVFLLAAALVRYLCPERARAAVLLAFSWLFYAAWNPVCLLFLIFTTVSTYLTGRYVSGRSVRAALFLCVAANLGVLFFCKYWGMFFPGIFEQRLLPVGISFYTLQALGYVVDCCREGKAARASAQASSGQNSSVREGGKTSGAAGPRFLTYALFVSFFPGILSGPIERGRNMLPQFEKPCDFSFDNLRNGLLIMTWGYFLKMVLADRIAIVVNQVYANPEGVPGTLVVLAVLLYSIQIYCDFAGYSAIAIGSARVLGFRVMQNFTAPYLSASVAEFWRHWHISLSTWFRDYLYFPLGGSRKGKARTYINVLIVFALSGLWHGAAMKYVLWGLLFGVFQVIGGLLTPAKQRLCAALHIPWDAGWLQIIRVVITFGLSTFAWIFFRADSALQACVIIKRIVTAAGACFPLDLTHLGLTERALHVLAVSLIGLVLTDIIGDRFPLREKLLETVWLRYAVWVILLAVTAVCGAYGTGFNPQEFVYFQF